MIEGSRRRGLILAAAALAVVVAVVTGVALGGATSVVTAPGPRVSASPTALATANVASPSAVAASPTQYPIDAAGVPTTIDGRPVLRGAAISARLATADTTEFLAAGWIAVRHAGILSLVEARTDHPATWFALMGPGTFTWQAPPDRAWPGGFVVLRVRPTCQMWKGYCLVVIAAVTAPAGGVPGPSPTPGAYDEAGIPREIDGQPVLRGTAIADRVASGGAEPFVVAGWFEHVSADCAGPNGSIVGCDFSELVDSVRGGPGDGPELQDANGQMWFGGSAGPQGTEWPGAFTVLRVRAGCAGDRAPALCLTVLAAIAPPADLAPSPTPLPMPSIPPVVWSGDLPTVVDGEQLLGVRDIGLNITSLRAVPKETLLVAGYVEPAASGCTARACPKDKAAILVEPLDLEAAAFGSTAPSGPAARYQLLRADGSPYRAPNSAAWPKALYVLRIRAWMGACPWPGSCRTALVVTKAIAPR